MIENNCWTYSEDEAISTPEDITQETRSLPHHFDEIFRHEDRLFREIEALSHEAVAMESKVFAPLEGHPIDCNQEEVIEEELGILPFAEASQEEVKQAVLFCVGFIQYADDYSLVRHSSSLQGYVELISRFEHCLMT